MGPDPGRALLGDGTEIPRAQAAPSTRDDAGLGRAAASAVEGRGWGRGQWQLLMAPLAVRNAAPLSSAQRDEGLTSQG